MKTVSSSCLLVLLLLLSLQPSNAGILDWLFGPRCPKGPNDLKWYLYYILDFRINLDLLPDDDSAVSFDGPGSCTTTYIKYSSTKEQLELMVTELYDGTAYRFNDLGLIRLKDAPFDCENAPWSDDYCGIALGMPSVDHEIVRPFLDETLGDGSVGGDQSSDGLRWSMEGLKASAEVYLATTDTINTGSAAQLWVIKEAHKASMGLDLTDDEAQELADLFGKLALRGVVGKTIPIGLIGNIKTRRKYIEIYETAIRAMIARGDVTTLADIGDNVKKAAWTLLDLFCFAAFPSVSSVISGALGYYYNGELDPMLDLSTHMDMGRVVFETVRKHPPVIGATRINADDGIRSIATPGMTGFDASVWDDDVLEFRVRRDFAMYQSTSLNWADAALPIPGVLHTNHVCPAKSFSFNLAVAFLLALDPETWEAPDVPAVPQASTMWPSFTVTRLPV